MHSIRKRPKYILRERHGERIDNIFLNVDFSDRIIGTLFYRLIMLVLRSGKIISLVPRTTRAFGSDPHDVCAVLVTETLYNIHYIHVYVHNIVYIIHRRTSYVAGMWPSRAVYIIYIYDTTDSSHRCCKLWENVYIIITIATTSPVPFSPFAPFIISFPDMDCNSNLVSILSPSIRGEGLEERYESLLSRRLILTFGPRGWTYFAEHACHYILHYDIHAA